MFKINHFPRGLIEGLQYAAPFLLNPVKNKKKRGECLSLPCAGYGPEHWVIYHCWYMLLSASIGGGKCVVLENIPTHPREDYLKFQGEGTSKLKLEFSEVWRFQTKTFHRRSVDIFWNSMVPKKFRVLKTFDPLSKTCVLLASLLILLSSVNLRLSSKGLGVLSNLGFCRLSPVQFSQKYIVFILWNHILIDIEDITWLN